MIPNADLLKEISSKELTELSDLNGTGELNQDVINDSIADAISFINSFIAIPDNPTPLLKNIACELTIWELRKRNDLTTKKSKERLKELESYLLKMAAKKIPTKIEEQEIAKPKTSNFFSFKHKNKKLNTKGYR